jgi:predicted ATP-dependent Lon-type protease
LLKLLYPNEEYNKEAVRRCLEYALEVRRRVKEQLKKIGGMEFFDVHFSYIDVETMEEKGWALDRRCACRTACWGTTREGVDLIIR